MSNPLISVIVPIFNVDNYLRECIESLVNQTLTDIEIICVNDGSTDNSLSIIEEYAIKDDRIVIINKKNTGYGNTMNVGLEIATGDYIGIVESDDFAELEMFQKLYEAANNNNAEVVKSNYYEFKTFFRFEKKFIEMLEVCEYNKVFSPTNETEIFFTPVNIWTGIYKREFLINNKIYFNETIGASYQDISFMFKVLACAKRVFVIKDAFLNYRRDNLNSSVNSNNKIFCVCDEFKEIERFLLNSYSKSINTMNFIKFYLKYKTYKWNYNRLGSAFQYAFLMKMSSDLKIDYESGFLDKRYWNETEIKELQCIINDINKYFNETAKEYHDERLLLSSTSNLQFYKQGFFDWISRYRNIIIFGAGVIGKRVANELVRNKKNIFCFAVSDTSQNIESVLGIKVYCINELIEYAEDSVIVISVKERDQYDIINNLRKLNFKNIVSIDSILLNELNSKDDMIRGRLNG